MLSPWFETSSFLRVGPIYSGNRTAESGILFEQGKLILAAPRLSKEARLSSGAARKLVHSLDSSQQGVNSHGHCSTGNVT